MGITLTNVRSQIFLITSSRYEFEFYFPPLKLSSEEELS